MPDLPFLKLGALSPRRPCQAASSSCVWRGNHQSNSGWQGCAVELRKTYFPERSRQSIRAAQQLAF
eukprot:scaffold185934_cov15-Tisochrysis_lutea.AAC.1